MSERDSRLAAERNSHRMVELDLNLSTEPDSVFNNAENAKPALLIILSAPSGCGKSTLVHRLMLTRPYLLFSVSLTTRQPREGEIDGTHYHFVSKPEFEEMIRRDAFLEYASYAGNYYGTPRAAVEEALSKGRDVLLEIDIQGASRIMKLYPDALTLFLLPPSMEELERRLTSRGQNSPEDLRIRIAHAEQECLAASAYRYRVVNEDIDRAVREVNDIIEAEKCKRSQKG